MNLDLMELILEIICQKKINDGAYVVILDEYPGIRTHWIALYISINDDISFDSFGVEHIRKQTKNFFRIKNIKKLIQNTSK